MKMSINPNDRLPYLVSFSGIDGAGKSTQINALRRRMEDSGMRVSLVAFWDDVAQLTSLRETTGHALFKGDKGVGSPEAPINRRDKNIQSRTMTALRFLLYFLDGLSLRRVAHKARRSGADLIIFDRFAYDELVNLKLQNPLARGYARLIARIVPRPDIRFLIDADPVQARARKPEYPLEFLAACRQSYLSLGDLLGGCFTVIPPMPVEDVTRAVMQSALEMLPNSSPSASLATSQDLLHQR